MLTRKKLRQVFQRHKQGSQKMYFKNLKTSSNNTTIINKFSTKSHNFDGFEIDKSSIKNNVKASKSDVATFIKTHYLKFNGKSPVSCVKTKIETDLSKTMKNSENLDTFHRAVRPIFLMAQCFAVMPVVGMSNHNPHHLRFSFISLQMLVSLLFFFANGLLFVTMMKHLTNLGINAKNFVGLAFFFCAQVACVLFIILARRWPKLIQNWTHVEMIFTQSSYEEPKRNLRKRIRLAAFILIGLAMIEHALSVTSAVMSYTRRVHICAEVQNISRHISFDEYIHSNYTFVFSLLTYTTFAGIFILITNGMSTFIWNYMDIFIMMVSKGIAYRFEQIMMRINKVANQDVSERTFIEIRTHYVQVCELLDNVDEHLSEIILLSCINNLYFVCYQLLNIFNKLRWPINHIYFWYSLLYLIGRTAFVFLTAASINDESKSALSALRSIPHRSWCVEVERLIFQMTTQTVALSGKKFYFMTRRLLFGMAGTIVTYELVLLQFDEPNRSKGLPPLCE